MFSLLQQNKTSIESQHNTDIDTSSAKMLCFLCYNKIKPRSNIPLFHNITQILIWRSARTKQLFFGPCATSLYSSWTTNYLKSGLNQNIFWSLTGWACVYLHWLRRNFSSDKSDSISRSILIAPGPGRRIVAFPTTRQGSLPFFLLPAHHPPGTIMFGPRNKSSASILSSTGSSLWNFRANGALPSTMRDISSMVR